MKFWAGGEIFVMENRNIIYKSILSINVLFFLLNYNNFIFV